ncbi:MAG: hypothetical protein RR983_02565 [Massilia sp.]|uniref:hypothetical protein n=1 Tax=Massilia sp. TaxID=1882437 RepID=UPI002FCB41E9
MAAVTKTPVPILAAVAVPAGGTKASPNALGIGPWIDVSAFNGGVLGGRIRNTGGTLTAPGQMAWQWTPELAATPTKVYDLWSFGGDLASASDVSVSIRLDKEIGRVRAICYGNVTNAVTFESDLAAGS